METLPPQLRLNSFVHNNYDEVRQSLDDYYQQHHNFVDDQLEHKYGLDLIDYTDVLTDCYTGQPGDQQSREVAYNAFHFALTAAAVCMPQEAPVDIHNLDLVKYNDLCQEARQFLGRHEFLDSLVANYMLELDPTGQNSDLVEAIAGLTFRQIEQNILARYIGERVFNFGVLIDVADDDLYQLITDDQLPG